MIMTIFRSGEIAITLPGGLVRDDGWHRDAVLTPLTGVAEELMLLNPNAPQSALITTLLAQCIRRIGTLTPVTEALARDLLVADRLYALLMLRAVTFGSRIEAVVTCPRADCRAKMNIDFETTDLPVKPMETGQAVYGFSAPTYSDAISEIEIRVRLPNGSDQEAIEPLLRTGHEEAAAQRLLARCIVQLGDLAYPNETAIARQPPDLRQHIEAQMEALAPNLELTLEGECVACERPFSLPFNLAQFILRELALGAGPLYREVHYLAFHYHWGEGEIMRMPRTKRRAYIALLSEQIESAYYA
jgi:hypothetical protein